MHLIPGAVVGGKYQLVQALASGGMGCIWSAQHTTLGTPLAVKFIKPENASRPDLRGRFEREAIASARMSSAHVVQVYDYGIEDNTPYLVMELLEGEDLGARLTRETRLSLKAACDILIQIAKGLQRANAAGIIHRDLKPANIFLARDMDEEIVKILDFGLAKVTSSSSLSSSPVGATTLTGHLVGSPFYMSPEQMQESKSIDHRSDLWSLAVILFRAITGKLPFTDEDDYVLMMSILCGPTPVPSEIDPSLPRALDSFFQRAFQRDPSKRYQSAREMVNAFVEAALAEMSWSAWPTGGLGFGSRAGAAPISPGADMDPCSPTLPSATPPGLAPSIPPRPGRREKAKGIAAALLRRGTRGFFPWHVLGASVLVGIGLGWQLFPDPSAASGRAEQEGASAGMTEACRLSSHTGARNMAQTSPSLTQPLDTPISVLVDESEPAPQAIPATAQAAQSSRTRRPR